MRDIVKAKGIMVVVLVAIAISVVAVMIPRKRGRGLSSSSDSSGRLSLPLNAVEADQFVGSWYDSRNRLVITVSKAGQEWVASVPPLDSWDVYLKEVSVTPDELRWTVSYKGRRSRTGFDAQPVESAIRVDRQAPEKGQLIGVAHEEAVVRKLH